jgi:hypothetical protein
LEIVLTIQGICCRKNSGSDKISSCWTGPHEIKSDEQLPTSEIDTDKHFAVSGNCGDKISWSDNWFFYTESIVILITKHKKTLRRLVNDAGLCKSLIHQKAFFILIQPRLSIFQVRLPFL